MSANPEKDYHHGDLGRAALEAAMGRVQASGPDGLSLRELAASLGVTHRALYRHYTDRSALLAAVAASGFQRLAAQAAAATDREGFCRAYVRFALAEPKLYALMMQGLTPRPALLRAAEHALIQSARRVFCSDEAIKRAWILLHGGLALHSAGMLVQRDDETLETFLLGLLGD